MFTIAKAGKRALVVLLCANIAGQGCATVGAGVSGQAARERTAADTTLLGDYVQRLPPGTAVKVERTSGATLRGTLMKATDTSLVVQPRTRLPETPVEIPLAEVLAVTPEVPNGGGLARAIGAGAAAGAGAALAVFLILVAIFND